MSLPVFGADCQRSGTETHSPTPSRANAPPHYRVVGVFCRRFRRPCPSGVVGMGSQCVGGGPKASCGRREDVGGSVAGGCVEGVEPGGGGAGLNEGC